MTRVFRQFILINLLLVISFSVKSFAQVTLEASPAKSQALCSQELNPHPPLPKKLKNALDTLVRVRADLNNNPQLETIYLSKLQELKIQFLTQQIGEEIFDQYFVAAYQQELKKISATKEDTKEVQVEAQKQWIRYPLKDRTPQVIKAIEEELGIPRKSITWEDLEKITELNLSFRRITFLHPNDLLGLKNLTMINLSHNYIKIIPQNFFQNAPSLKIIYLSENQIVALFSDTFKGLFEIEEIYLSKNKIGELPENLFRGLKKLRKIILSFNLIQTLPKNILKGLYALNYLELKHNHIQSLPPKLLSGSKNLGVLDLSYNELSQLPKDFFNHGSPISLVDLKFNQFTRFPKTYSKPFLKQGFNRLDLRDNPLSYLEQSKIKNYLNHKVEL